MVTIKQIAQEVGISSSTVSYTHLDVYKRQDKAHPLVHLGAACLREDILIPHALQDLSLIHI